MPKGRKPATDQYHIDFEERRRSRRQLIEAVAHHRTGLTLRLWTNCQLVLLYLVNCEGDQGIFPYIESIVEKTKLSRSTVCREIRTLKNLGILTADSQKNHRGRGSNLWTIHVAKLAALCQPKTGTDQCQDETDQSQVGTDQCQLETNALKGLSLTEPSFSALSTSTSTFVSSAVEPRIVTRPDEEEEILKFKRACRGHKILAQLLPLQFDDAIAAAVSRGVTVKQLYARVQWFGEHRGDWDPEHRRGALWYGLQHATPDMKVDQGWPFRR